MDWRVFCDSLRRWRPFWVLVFFIGFAFCSHPGEGLSFVWLILLFSLSIPATTKDFGGTHGLRVYRALPLSDQTLGRTLWLSAVLFPSALVVTSACIGVIVLGLISFGKTQVTLGVALHHLWIIGTAVAALTGAWFLFLSSPALAYPSPSRSPKSVTPQPQSVVPYLVFAVFLLCFLIPLVVPNRPLARLFFEFMGPLLLVSSFVYAPYFPASRALGNSWRNVAGRGEMKGRSRSLTRVAGPIVKGLSTDSRRSEDTGTKSEPLPSLSHRDRVLSNPYGTALFLSIVPAVVFGGGALLVVTFNDRFFGTLLSYFFHPVVFTAVTIWMVVGLVMPWLPGRRVAGILPLSRFRLTLAILGVLATAVLPILVSLGIIFACAAVSSIPLTSDLAFRLLSWFLGLAAGLVFVVAVSLRWNDLVGFISLAVVFPAGLLSTSPSTGSTAGIVLLLVWLLGSIVSVHHLLQKRTEPFRSTANMRPPFS